VLSKKELPPSLLIKKGGRTVGLYKVQNNNLTVFEKYTRYLQIETMELRYFIYTDVVSSGGVPQLGSAGLVIERCETFVLLPIW